MTPHVLYRFYGANDTLLYVGLTTNPSRRFEKHRGEKSWWLDITRIEMQHFDSLEELRAAERNAIVSEKPQHNIRNGASPRPIDAKPTDAEPEGLVGRFFHTWEDDEEGGKKVCWQGHILSQISPTVYLVELFSWWDGCANGQHLEDVSAMVGWTFYDSAKDMQIALGCREWHKGVLCGAQCTHEVKLGELGRLYTCSACSRYYTNAKAL